MKNYFISLLVAISAVFAPAKGMILTALALIIVDLITGLMAAKKSQIPITSSGIGRTVVKLLVYEGAIMLAFLTQQYLTGPSVPISNIVASLIGLTELTSVLENMNTISGNNLLKAILDKLGSSNQK